MPPCITAQIIGNREQPWLHLLALTPCVASSVCSQKDILRKVVSKIAAGILTAEENRVWQKFKDGGNTAFDYDTMGGVMRDNIKAGGNVYLDGRVVGNVISEQQGRAYRTLQRSGWQG